ncbi:argininosuccinate lyase-like isoform X2 [Ornithodoros turicata]|uniref:argininosuccinate lyase-like isoform X2 n=1 Tax=Ornithodoros turicata TaxID=34597 RepID=UPI0031389820
MLTSKGLTSSEALLPALQQKLWGGRFMGSMNDAMRSFNSSIEVDRRLWKEDIEGSKAYGAALLNAGILTQDDEEQIQRGLLLVEREWESGTFVIKPSDEDIHSANERRLKELTGANIGGQLHTGRSRNDQVAVNMRLWLKKSIKEINSAIKLFISECCIRAKSEIDVLMPGYTHLQKAQPIRWSHWLLSYAWFLKQDASRFEDLFKRTDICPLGSGALAGNPFCIDRERLASALNFGGISQNSMMAVGDRDFVVEFLFAVSMTAVHLSKWAEDMIIYSSSEFGFVSIDDAFSTGSSLMPQKKNPDSLELIRGKAGRCSGHLYSLQMVLKGLPSTYNKDLQEDKALMFDAYDTLISMLMVAAGTLKTLKLHRGACTSALSSEMLSTDVAYYLVRKGMPFREAHHAVGNLVALAETKAVGIEALEISETKRISPLFDEDLKELWNYEHSVEQYQATGGTSRKSVEKQVASLQDWLERA